MPQDFLQRSTFAKVVAWAAYLACSWTWCIGMFLPVLLIRDFGYTSFFVFAVPNVVGAMLMGVVLARPGASEAFVQRHRAACALFSAVTLAFQVFFLIWMVRGALPASDKWILAAILPVALLVRSHRSNWAATFAQLLLIASLLCALFWIRSSPPLEAQVLPQLPPRDLAWLAPVCLFGFALCPYLDLTFHAARQRLPGRPGSVAFVIGFGLFFLLMILMTFVYAGPLIHRALDARLPLQPGLLAIPLLIHVASQLAYTSVLHADALRVESPGNWSEAKPVWAAAAGLTLGVLAGNRLDPELIYRCFMAFYGLVFPAYVWICAFGRPQLTRRALTVCAVAVIAATPFYWMGFIERDSWWLGPGVLIAVAARWLVGKQPQPASATPA